MHEGRAATRGWQIARKAREAFDLGLLAQPTGQLIQRELDQAAPLHGSDHAADDGAAERLARGHQRVAEPDAFVQLGGIAARGQTQGRLAAAVAGPPVPA
jgi:hypothetical protein